MSEHIAVGTTSLPDRFEDASSLLYAREVSEDEYTQLNCHENRVKNLKSHALENNKHFSALKCTKMLITLKNV